MFSSPKMFIHRKSDAMMMMMMMMMIIMAIIFLNGHGKF